MAIVILFGRLTSMLLNMLIVPALYLRFGRPVQMAQEGGPRCNACCYGLPRSLDSGQAVPYRLRRSLPVTERHVMVPTVATIGPVSPAAALQHERNIEHLMLP